MLPHDYTRCMGETPMCPQRDRCARFRDQPENTVLSWTRNLNIEGIDDCLHFIEYNHEH